MGKKFTSDHPTTAEILRLKKPNEKQCDILLDPALKHQIEAKEKQIEVVQSRKRRNPSLAEPGPDALESELDDLYSQARELVVTFTFRDIGKKVHDALQMAHPPTPDDISQWERGGGQGKLAYSLTTFPPALISACAIAPLITPDEAQTIWDTWGEGDIETLFLTAMTACMEKTSIPKSRRGTGLTTDSALNSTTALSEESNIPSS